LEEKRAGCSNGILLHSFYCGLRSELLGFWTLPIVRYSRNLKTQYLGSWICFRPQVRGETPTLLGLHKFLISSMHSGSCTWLCWLVWSINFYLHFYPSSLNVRALSQFLLNIFLLSPVDIAWSQVFR
jgi:hypothetical protein